MKTIDEIIEQYAPYSKSIPTWDREDITDMMKKYAAQVLDHLLETPEEYIYIDSDSRDFSTPDEAVFNYEAIERLKQSLK